MIERIGGMPEGTAGFDFIGEVTSGDYEEVLVPALRDAVAGDGQIRVVCVLGPEFDGYEAGAMWADAKAGARFGIGHHSSWHRVAVVTDHEWVHHLTALFGWLSPGELRVFPVAELDDAKTWVAG
jgi:hypothetical protein